MTYSVKSVFYTLQGEGTHAGRPAVFCRFAGCNFWTGREEDRAASICTFCDTDFLGTDGEGGGKFKSSKLLADHISSRWPLKEGGRPYVVFTGGEPLLQLDLPLISELKSRGFELAIETNGSLPAPAGIDWITVSPKTLEPLVQTHGNELKLVYPQSVLPEQVSNLAFDHFYLSPLDPGNAESLRANTALAIEYCLANPQWKLTMQHHKLWMIP